MSTPPCRPGLVARTWVESLTHLEGRLHVSPEAFAVWLPRDYERRLGENPFDTYGVASHHARPSSTSRSCVRQNPQAFTRFDARAAASRSTTRPEIRAVMREWQTANPMREPSVP